MSNRVMKFQMYAGVDLIGSKTSMHESRSISLEATAIGIKMHSKGSNRTVVVPYSNVKGFELYPGGEPKEPSMDEQIKDANAGLEAVLAPKRRGRPPKDA